MISTCDPTRLCLRREVRLWTVETFHVKKLQMVFLIFLKSGDVKSDRRNTGRENGERNGGIDSQDRTLPVDVLFIARVGWRFFVQSGRLLLKSSKKIRPFMSIRVLKSRRVGQGETTERIDKQAYLPIITTAATCLVKRFCSFFLSLIYTLIRLGYFLSATGALNTKNHKMDILWRASFNNSLSNFISSFNFDKNRPIWLVFLTKWTNLNWKRLDSGGTSVCNAIYPSAQHNQIWTLRNYLFDPDGATRSHLRIVLDYVFVTHFQEPKRAFLIIETGRRDRHCYIVNLK